MITPYLTLFFMVIALTFFLISIHQKRKAGIPPGKIIYIDTRQWGKVEKPLFDPDLRLTGKPDYLVKQSKQVIPIEVKSRKAPQFPYDSHIFQLAAYCLLVQYEYGVRPDHGIIHYTDRSFAVEFTTALQNRTKEIIQEMQGITKRSQVNRSHDDPKRCLHCGYRSICDQSLRI